MPRREGGHQTLAQELGGRYRDDLRERFDWARGRPGLSLCFPTLPARVHRREQRARHLAVGGLGCRNGCMESPERVELPAAFEDVDVDVLVQLIGASPSPDLSSC